MLKLVTLTLRMFVNAEIFWQTMSLSRLALESWDCSCRQSLLLANEIYQTSPLIVSNWLVHTLIIVPHHGIRSKYCEEKAMLGIILLPDMLLTWDSCMLCSRGSWIRYRNSHPRVPLCYMWQIPLVCTRIWLECDVNRQNNSSWGCHAFVCGDSEKTNWAWMCCWLTGMMKFNT